MTSRCSHEPSYCVCDKDRAVDELCSRIIARILNGPYGGPTISDPGGSQTCFHNKYRWEDCVDCAMIDMAKDIEEMK